MAKMRHMSNQDYISQFEEYAPIYELIFAEFRKYNKRYKFTISRLSKLSGFSVGKTWRTLNNVNKKKWSEFMAACTILQKMPSSAQIVDNIMIELNKFDPNNSDEHIRAIRRHLRECYHLFTIVG